MTAALRRAALATGRFLWSFVIDDTPEVLVAAVVIVGAALALRHWRAVAVAALPLLTVAGLGLGVWRGYRRRVGEMKAEPRPTTPVVGPPDAGAR